MMRQAFRWAIGRDGIARPLLVPGMKRPTPRRIVVAAVLAFGFLAWIAAWLEGDHRRPASQTGHVAAGAET